MEIFLANGQFRGFYNNNKTIKAQGTGKLPLKGKNSE